MMQTIIYVNSKMWVAGICCDLTKAFDYVNHNTLLTKLEFYGIRGCANKLIKSYLDNKYQRIQIKNKYSKKYFSEWDIVKRGVPQGSILGPLIFLLYINDLPGIINNTFKPTISADDTNIILTHSNLTVFKDQFNIVIEKISNWFRTSSLMLNFKKTYYMHLVTNLKRSVNISISYTDNFINNTRRIKFLGLSLDSTLSWKIHIEQLSSRLNLAYYAIRFLKSFISIKNLRIIYFSYVHSIIMYGIVFWGI